MSPQVVYPGVMRRSKRSAKKVWRFPSISMLGDFGRVHFPIDGSGIGIVSFPFGKVQITYGCYGDPINGCDWQLECFKLRGVEGTVFQNWPRLGRREVVGSYCFIYRHVSKYGERVASGWYFSIDSNDWALQPEKPNQNFCCHNRDYRAGLLRSVAESQILS